MVRDFPASSGSSSTASINRSMSLLTTVNSRIPILAPHRGERARLEALLADVWTRDALPFPGMTARSRSEYLVKASATSMMRRLSVASIAGSFGRRSQGGRHRGGDGGDDGHQPPARRLSRSEPAPRTGSEAAQPSSVLSSIPDEGYPAVESEWGIDVLRTVGYMGGDAVAKRARDETAGEEEPAALRPRSPNKKRAKRTFSTLKKRKSAMCASISEKENGYGSPPKKAGGRWNKVGGLRGEAVVKGIRSLFH